VLDDSGGKATGLRVDVRNAALIDAISCKDHRTFRLIPSLDLTMMASIRTTVSSKMPIESWHAALDTNLNDTFLHAQRFARSYAPRVRAGVA